MGLVICTPLFCYLYIPILLFVHPHFVICTSPLNLAGPPKQLGAIISDDIPNSYKLLQTLDFARVLIDRMK
jgi:hypothetical protein